MTDRVIAIGDIHGHSSILKVVLDSINPQPEDTFVFLGDLVNRGPNSKGVIEQVLELKKICNVNVILGNHEEMILAAFAGGKSEVNFWKKFGGIQTLASYRAEEVRGIDRNHLLFIAEFRDYLETEDYIFVHAGCDPDLPLHQNSQDILRWNKLSKKIKPHMSGKIVVCGHTAQKKILNLGHLICIDTGCGIWEGGRLSAVDLVSGKIWQATGRSKKATIKSLNEQNDNV